MTKSNKIQNILSDFEKFIHSSKPSVSGFDTEYKKAVWEMMENGGKRFRPGLIFCVVDAFNPLLIKNAYLPALSIETLHTYSLIHDDLPLMDDAPLRRGAPTLHTKYGDVMALLVGDGLNTYAFYLLSNAKLNADTKIDLIKYLSYNAGIDGMVLGQVLDCLNENIKLELDKLEIIHLNKTAKLIATSLYFGARIVEADSKMCEDLYNFGIRLGVYFQIRDDILDATSSDIKEGKTTHNDASKNSFVNLLGLDEAKAYLDKERDALKSSMDSLPKILSENLNAFLSKYFEDIN